MKSSGNLQFLLHQRQRGKILLALTGLQGSNEVANQRCYLLLMVQLGEVVLGGIDGENGKMFELHQPFLMSLMNFAQVAQWNSLLPFPVPDFDALQTQFRWASEVHDTSEWRFPHKFLAKLAVDIVFCSFQIALPVHEFPEDMSISKWRSLRKEERIGMQLSLLLPEQMAGVKCVELEGESPSFGIHVVVLEDVAARHVGPLVDWLLDSRYVEHGQQCALTCSQVALDGNDS